MKATSYQNILLSIIALCLIVITLSLTGIIQNKPLSVKVDELGIFGRTERGRVLPVEIIR